MTDFETTDFETEHRPAVSVGSLTKKILEIAPELGAQEIIGIIRSSSHAASGSASVSFGEAPRVDEPLALRLAKELSERKKSPRITS